MRVSPMLAAFNAGELSPQLRGRLDLEKYSMGCETLENFICRVHGGVQRRPGSYFLGETKDSSKYSRLIPFQYNTEQAYMLEFGDSYIRVFKDYAPVEVSGAAYEIASPYADEDIFDIQYVQDADIMYLVHNYYPVYKLSRTADDSWTLETVTFIDGPYLEENDTATTIAPSATSGTGITLTASASLFTADHVGAYFRILHGSTWGYVKITYVTDATHATADVLSTLGGTSAVTTWREGAFSDAQGYPSTVAFNEQRLILGCSISRPQTFWASVAGDYEDMTPGADDDDAYTYTIAERKVNAIRWMAPLGQLVLGTTGGEARLGPQDSGDPITPSNAKVTFQSFYGSAPTPAIPMGNVILFWEGRGHPLNYGQRLRELGYNFTTDSYEAADLTLLAEHIADGGVFEMALQKYPFQVLWCVRADGLLIGMTYDRQQDVVGWHRHPMSGTVESVAVIPGDSQDDLYMIVNRTVGGVTKRYIEVLEDYDWGENQEDCFFVDCAMSYDGTEKTITGATKADPVVISATAHGFVNGDHVHLSDIEGMTELNGLEVVVTNKATDGFQCYDVKGNAIDGTGFTTYTGGGIAKKMAINLTGMDHLAGETVDVLADGAMHPPVTITAGGVVALRWYVRKAHVGIHFESKLTTMSLEGGSREGTAQGKTKRAHEATVRFYETLGGKVGSDPDYLDDIIFRTSADTFNNPPPLFTGDKTLSLPSDWEEAAKVTVVQDQPLPMTVLSIMPRFRTEDR